MEVIDPNILFEKLKTSYNKDFKPAEHLVECKTVLAEILKTKTTSKKQNNIVHRNFYPSKNDKYQ